MSKPTRNRLSDEQRKQLLKVESNAGVGWFAEHDHELAPEASFDQRKRPGLDDYDR